MKDILKFFLIYAIYLCTTAFCLIGIFHSFKKHSIESGVCSIIIPPYGFYQGLEQFWHNDYSDINWNKQLKIDMENIVGVLNESVNSKNQTKNIYYINLEIQDIAEYISKYPKDKIEYLKTGTQKYITMRWLILNDIREYILYIDINKKFKYSNKTLFVKNDLSNNYSLKETIELDDSTVIYSLPKIDSSNIGDFNKNKTNKIMNELKNTYKILYEQSYEKIFNEKFILK